MAVAVGTAEARLAGGLDHGFVIGEIAGRIAGLALVRLLAGCSICEYVHLPAASCACAAMGGSAGGIAYSGFATVSTGRPVLPCTTGLFGAADS